MIYLKKYFDGIVADIEANGDDADIEKIRELRNVLHNGAAVAQYLNVTKPSLIVPHATTTVGNIAVDLKPFLITCDNCDD